VFVVTMLVATVGGLGPAAAAASWSVVPSVSPAGEPGGSLVGVACPTASSCYAVGSFGVGDSGAALVEHWNGTEWSIMSVPDGGNVTFAAVSCASDTRCFAIGSGPASDRSVIERWNGIAWAAVANPAPSLLLAVTCGSETECLAVGVTGTTIETTIVEQWNGSTWSVVASPSVADAQASELHAVSCASADNCFAVGNAFNGITPRTLTEHWDGSSWSIVASPTPAGGGLVSLDGVSCPGDTSCYATGSDQGAAGDATISSLNEHWNGSAWSIIPGGTNIEVSNLTCWSDTNCFGVGISNANPKGVRHGVIQHWNGTAWSISTIPAVTPASNFLNGIACASSSTCFAVGAGGGSLNEIGIIERGNGSSWSQVTQSFNPAPPNSTLSAMACPSATTCFGVGQYTNRAGTVVTLVERSAGAGVTIVPSPSRAGVPQSELAGISCVSASSCVAVGSSGLSPVRTLVEQWNGAKWAAVSSANHSIKSPYVNLLNGVACTTADNCFAVGTYNEGSINGTFDTLIEHWDGKVWSLVSSPNRSTFGLNTLEDVSCPSASSCFAVGQSSTDPAGTDRTLIEHWNGTTWSTAGSPDAPGQINDNLTGVACVGTKFCVAVGSTSTRTASTSLIETYNGSSWRIVATADPVGATETALTGVSCSTAQTCHAVGSSGSATASQALVKTMSGATWSTVAAVGPVGALSSSLAGISCKVSSCAAVGDYVTPGAVHTLVERQ